MPRRCSFHGGTWIDPEEHAYPSGSLRRSHRKFVAIWEETGELVVGTAAIPDTFFSIPAKIIVRGAYVGGYLYIDTEQDALVFRSANAKRVGPLEKQPRGAGFGLLGSASSAIWLVVQRKPYETPTTEVARFSELKEATSHMRKWLRQLRQTGCEVQRVSNGGYSAQCPGRPDVIIEVIPWHEEQGA